MKQLFLKAKHWQLFIFTLGLPFLMMIVIMVTIFSIISSVSIQNQPKPENFTFLFIIIPIFVLLGNFTQFYWIYTVSTALQQYQSPMTRTFKLNRFKFFFFVPLVHLTFVSVYIHYMTQSIGYGNEPNFLFAALGGVIIFFLHLLTMFAIIYTMYFTAKTITSVEKKMETHFSDYIGDFFLIWFFPVGVWFIQPRINRIIEEQTYTNYEELIDK